MNKTGALLDIIKKSQFQVDSRLICVKQHLTKFKSKNGVPRGDTITKNGLSEQKLINLTVFQNV